MVVGVTNEEEGKVEAYVRKHGIEYPIVIEASGASMATLGVRGIPSSFLVDSKGKIVWKGHPAALTDRTVESALDGAVAPFARLEGPLQPVQGLLDKGRKGKALETLRAMLDGDSLQGDQRKIAEYAKTGLEAEAEELAKEGRAAADDERWFEAGYALHRLVRQFEGHDLAAKAEDDLKMLRKTTAVRKEIDGAEKLLEAEALEAQREYDDAWRTYRSVTSLFKRTAAAKAAEKAMKRLDYDGLLGYRADCDDCESLGKACDKHRK